MTRILLLAVVLAVVAVPAGSVADPAGKCSGAKLKAAAKKMSNELKCHAKANLRGEPVEQECLDKAEAKFSSSWQRIEAAGGCRTTSDETIVESWIDGLVSSLAVKLAPCGSIEGQCGGSCPFGLNCFEIGLGCYGEPEPCRCHGSTTTCPITTSTTTTLP